MPFLSNFFRRWDATSTNNPDRKTGEKKLSKYEQAKTAFKRLETTASFDVLKAKSIKIQCTDPNIGLFYDRVVRYRETLQAQESITPSMCFGELSVVSLDDFFTTGGMYVNQHAIAILCRVLGDIFTSIDAERALEGGMTYTERLLNKTFITIISLEEATRNAQ